ncbi:U-box domain-containing protein [Podospora didyma]|uniref:RING-type E3 ubiquitin transferase n=1 Tax=Podospora didyma TaxID=330526 RepID=A0AAE0U3W2_9PEZI|nr:U-box domain-containing protein [Podospora didyma]
MAARALQLKEEGNLHFKKGDYVSAEALYSKAIIADPSNYNLYTNRAMARLKMNLWESVVSDCNECLQRNPDNIKAHYYLSQAYLPLHDYEGALQNGLRAHELCIQTGDKSLSAVTSQILRCKQERWDAKEKRRKRENSELETEMVVMMERERDQALSELGEDDDSYRREITEDWEHKIETMRSVFEKARSNEEKRRKVPDWAIDDISFGFMVDPVVVRLVLWGILLIYTYVLLTRH